MIQAIKQNYKKLKTDCAMISQNFRFLMVPWWTKYPFFSDIGSSIQSELLHHTAHHFVQYDK